MNEDVSLAELPDTLKPIKVSQWQEACEWINLRWGKTSWTDDVALYEDAKFWCEDELWGGMQSLLEKGTSFAPTFSELTKAVMEWRQHHLQNALDKYKVKELPPPAGSLKHYLKSIGAESFAHAAYMATQQRAKNNKLEKYEDKEAYESWTMPWEQAKATYMVGLSKSIESFSGDSQDNVSWDDL
jgi:hypothetical protein